MKKKLLNVYTIIALLIVLFAATATCVRAFSFRNMTLDFIQISDTHITDRQDTSYKALGSSKLLLKDAIEQINDIKGLDFVLFTGDMVDSADEVNFQSYYDFTKKLKYPSLNAFGNHDFYGMEKEDVLDIVRNNNLNYTFDDTYYAFSPKTDYRIIILDSTIKNENTANGELSQEQLDFLDNELAQNQDKIVLIAMHHPSVEPFASRDHALNNANEFNEILLKYKNPIIVVSGHYHASKIRKIGNLVFVSTPAMVTYPMAFRHIKITNYKDRVKYEFNFIPTRLNEVKEHNRQSVISYSMLEGGLKDKDYTFTYYKKHPKSIRYKRVQIKKAAKEKITSKREIKKLSKRKTVKTKSQNLKKEKAGKVKTQKVKNEKIKTQKVKTEKVKKTKVQKTGFFSNLKNKIFKNKKQKTNSSPTF